MSELGSSTRVIGDTHARYGFGFGGIPAYPGDGIMHPGPLVAKELFSFKAIPQGEQLVVRGYLRRDYRRQLETRDRAVACVFGEFRLEVSKNLQPRPSWSDRRARPRARAGRHEVRSHVVHPDRPPARRLRWQLSVHGKSVGSAPRSRGETNLGRSQGIRRRRWRASSTFPCSARHQLRFGYSRLTKTRSSFAIGRSSTSIASARSW